MHPEIVRDGPGSCPICGMALEPMEIAAEEEESAELVDMRRRFAVSAVLTLPLFALAMTEMWLPVVHGRAGEWLQLALATPVVLWGGWPFLVRGWRSLATRRLNMFTLIAIGTVTAYGFSAVALLAPASIPASFRDAHGAAPLYFESAAAGTSPPVLLGLGLSCARGCRLAAVRALPGSRRRSRTASMSAAPKPTCRSSTGRRRLRVRPARRFPSTVSSSTARAMDESTLTGKPEPARKQRTRPCPRARPTAAAAPDARRARRRRHAARLIVHLVS
jgi:Cu+-exporting ATPase